jgi:hypothetical protein
MQWNSDLIMMAPEDILINGITELLSRMGFRDYERVANRREWGVDIVAVRDDPLTGTEKIVIALHRRGLASSKDVNVFADLVNKYKAEKGIIISPAGFTKDSKVLIARDYRGKIVPWDGDKLVSLFQNYGVEAPEELALMKKEEEKEEKDPLNEFELDAPLLYEFSPEGLLKTVSKVAAEGYPIKPAEIKLKSLSVSLSSAYIFSWSLDGGDVRDKAVVFSSENVTVKSSEDERLKTPVTKALLNDSSSVRATEREIEVPLTPSEAVLVLKAHAARELGVPEGRIVIHERKKVYIPLSARLSLGVGENTATASVNLSTGDVVFEIEPLPDEYFLKTAREAVFKTVNEEPEGLKLERDGGKVRVTGGTARFSFELTFNAYTGRLVRLESLMNDAALDGLLSSLYRDGNLLNLEKGKKVAVADILTGEGIAVVEIDLTTGTYSEVRKLPSPETAFENSKEIIEENFPLRDLSLNSYRILEHKYIELEAVSGDGVARVKIDGATGDILDYSVSISPERASEVFRTKYPGFKITSLNELDEAYEIRAEDGRQEVTVKLSKDGKLLEETDRALKREVVEEIAGEEVAGIDEDATIRGVSLDTNWRVEFAGSTKVGTLTIHRSTGEVLERDVRFTEMAIEEAFKEKVRREHGESNLQTERLTHYKDKGYITIKLSGEKALYYAKIDVRTGKVLSQESAPIKGITARLKQLQLDNKYK